MQPVLVEKPTEATLVEKDLTTAMAAVVAGARLGQSFGRFVWGMRNARGADAESTRS
ncbi:hypothetical protein PGT21_011113 [Puccinia graminis f. sp. tritici]|uniref:Uncharacterized protein n=1 Tax=Puccinia graminis f. sp. tritici TaxID=56615 RepID=A0A5B0MFB4_PUCGR|nr:hypothetical protein PGT21_011113 [Puccinia graminis f. sp. tritici]